MTLVLFHSTFEIPDYRVACKMSAKPLSPRDSGRFIAEHGQDVTINQDAAKKVAQMVRTIRLSL